MVYAKLCDFGLSVTKNNYDHQHQVQLHHGIEHLKYVVVMTTLYDVDIWSTGLIFFEIITNRPLIKTKKDKDQDIFRKIITKIPEKLKNSRNKFIYKKRKV